MREFNVIGSRYAELEEYVIACPIKKLINGYVFPFYISKEYNVSPLDELYMPARFLFINFWTDMLNISNDFYLLLAEEPAIGHGDPDFNVELHYLQLRKHVQPGEILNSWIESM